MGGLSRRIVISAMMATLTAGFAQGPQAGNVGSPDVNLSPKRIVVADGVRDSQEVIVFNRGTAAATYAITLVDRRMTSDGQLLELDEAAAHPNSAAGMIRYSPRRVTLGPGQSQVVRLQVRRPVDLPTGEYRSHFMVSAIPPTDAGLTIDAAAGSAAPGGIQVQITPVYGVSIPLIVRQGDLTAEVAITGVARAAESEGEASLRVTFSRRGNRSAYGDVTIRTGGPNGAVVGQLRGVGIYPELDTRTVTVPLAPEAVDLPVGSVFHVTYVDQDAKPGAELAATTAAV